MNIEIILTESQREFIEQQAAKGAFASPGDYVQALIENERRRAEHDELERKLLAALETQPVELNDEMKRRLHHQCQEGQLRSWRWL